MIAYYTNFHFISIIFYFVGQKLFTRWHQAYFSDMAENVTQRLKWSSTQQCV